MNMLLMKDIIQDGHPTLRIRAKDVKMPLSFEDLNTKRRTTTIIRTKATAAPPKIIIFFFLDSLLYSRTTSSFEISSNDTFVRDCPMFWLDLFHVLIGLWVIIFHVSVLKV